VLNRFPCDTSPRMHADFKYRALGCGKCRISKCAYGDRINAGRVLILVKNSRAAIRAKMVAGPHAAITRPLVKPRMPFDSYIGLWVPSLDREGTTRSTLAFQAVTNRNPLRLFTTLYQQLPTPAFRHSQFYTGPRWHGSRNHDFFLSALGLCAALAPVFELSTIT
jgi:hypothetical protein